MTDPEAEVPPAAVPAADATPGLAPPTPVKHTPRFGNRAAFHFNDFEEARLHAERVETSSRVAGELNVDADQDEEKAETIVRRIETEARASPLVADAESALAATDKDAGDSLTASVDASLAAADASEHDRWSHTNVADVEADEARAEQDVARASRDLADADKRLEQIEADAQSIEQGGSGSGSGAEG